SRTPMPGPRARCCLPPIMWLGNGDRDAISSRRIRGGDPPARGEPGFLQVPSGWFFVRAHGRFCDADRIRRIHLPIRAQDWLKRRHSDNVAVDLDGRTRLPAGPRRQERRGEDRATEGDEPGHAKTPREAMEERI